MSKQPEVQEFSAVSNIVLNQKITGSGKGRHVCLVSDSRVNLAPTADQVARFFVADGWEVTLLDLNREADLKKQTINQQAKKGSYSRIRLYGRYRNNSWYTPLQSLCAWQQLKNENYDLIIFQHGFGAAYYSLMARKHHSAFAKTPIGLFICDTSEYWVEKTAWLSPTAPRTEMEMANMERQSVATADIIMMLNGDVAQWMKSTGWHVSSSVSAITTLGDNAKQSWGQWLTAQMENAAVPKDQKKIIISVCVVAESGTPFLADTIQSLIAQNTEDFEVVVLENGRGEVAHEPLRKQMAPLFAKRGWRWESQDKTTLHEARNKVAEFANGTHLYFLENGVSCLPEALKTLTVGHSSNGADILSSIPAFDPRRGDLFEAAALFPAPKSISVDNLLIAWVPPGTCTALAPILDIFGPCGFSIERNTFMALGGFQPTDSSSGALLIRALLASKKVVILPDVLSLHFFTKKRPARGDAFGKSVSTIRSGTELLPNYVSDALINLSAMVNISPYDANRRSPDAWYRLQLPRSISANADIPSIFRCEPQPGPVNIFMVFDDHYILPACVAINSIFTNTRAKVEIYAVTTLSQANADLLQKIAVRYNQTIHLISANSVKSKILHGASYFSNATDIAYVYTWLPEYLPANLKRIIFLDADILVRDDIAKLWNVDLDGEIVGAVPEYFVNSLAEAKQNYPYDEFNGGVMLLDLDAWRKANVTEDAVNWINYQEQNPHRCQFWSQTAFNMAIAGRWVPLPIAWNTTANALVKYCLSNGINKPGEEWIRKNSSIYHFAGPDKPWHKDFIVTAPCAGEYHMHVKMLASALPEAQYFDSV